VTTAGRQAADLREAAAWRLLGLLMERPRAGWIEEVEALAREAGGDPLRAAARAAREASEGQYLALLGPGGPVSPREVAYRDREDPARVLSDLASYYEAFAYRPRAEDPADHIAVEAGFIGYLVLKEAMALAAGSQEHAAVAAQARERFLNEHVAPFARRLAERLAGCGGHLEAAARAIQDRVAAD
jgi:TorA maturation chaperone TorD